MSDYITLLGAEDVKNASHRMMEAADGMKRSADHIESTLQNHARFMEEWLSQFEKVLEKHADTISKTMEPKHE